MNETFDWLARTAEIKRQLANRYKDRPASDQLREMRKAVQQEWLRRGWKLTLSEKSPSGVFSSNEQ